MKRRCRASLRKLRQATRLCVTIALLVVATVSCGRVLQPGEHVAVGGAFPFDKRVGWFHGPCLAISNPNLVRGTAVDLVIIGEPQRVQQAQIDERTNSSASCPALIEGRRTQNAQPGTFFYGVKGMNLSSTDMGVGVVDLPDKPTVVNGLARVHLYRDGHSEVFSSCATSEGIKFDLWTDKAYRGQPLWSRYYYLDYDMKPTCP